MDNDNNYVRFSISSRNSENKRDTYENDVNFFAIFNRDTYKCYLVDIISISQTSSTDIYLKLSDKQTQVKNTFFAEDYEISNLENIINKYEEELANKNTFLEDNLKSNEFSNEQKKNYELDQIVESLSEKVPYDIIKDSNKTLKEFELEFKKDYPKVRIFNRGHYHTDFRNFLTENLEIRTRIIEILKQKGIHRDGVEYYQIVRKFCIDYKDEYKKLPNTTKLYNVFLNIKTSIAELANSINLPKKSLINIDECSELVNLSKSTIYKKVCYGQMPVIRQAKHLMFDVEELDKWMRLNGKMEG